MERKIFHGDVQPVGVAQALLAEFNQGNLNAQTFGSSDKMAVQVSTRPGAMSGGNTALTITVQKIEEGVMVDIGDQAMLGVAASLGASALTALRNPLGLLGRLDDIAQDIENLQLKERVWGVVEQTIRAAGASKQLSERLRRITCEYCGTANPVGEASCGACGAPLGKAQPNTCRNCGFVIRADDQICPNCKQAL